MDNSGEIKGVLQENTDGGLVTWTGVGRWAGMLISNTGKWVLLATDAGECCDDYVAAAAAASAVAKIMVRAVCS